jgi:ribosome modulation factor
MQTDQSNVTNDAVLDYLRQYQQQRRACDEANGVLRSLLKRAKSDGINTKAMIATVTASKLDPEVVQQDMRDQIRYMALRNMPVHQVDLFGENGLDLRVTEKSREEDQSWAADDAGYHAGRHGARVEDCPYQAGSSLADHWYRSWKRGQEAIARELGPDVKPATASRKRPNREQQTLDTESGESGEDDGVETVGATPPLTERATKSRGRPPKLAANGARVNRPRASRASAAAH